MAENAWENVSNSFDANVYRVQIVEPKTYYKRI